MSSQHFILIASNGEFWQIPDPVVWCFQNIGQPILERAVKRLRYLAAEDRDSIVRIVTHRCRLNFLTIYPGEVVVHFWAIAADLKPFLKNHGLARKDVAVALLGRKHEVYTLTNGGEFLYGQPADPGLLTIYEAKWQKRFVAEADDWQPAPGSWTIYCWRDVKTPRFPWAALKAA